MCELLRQAKKLARKKGLDPRDVFCPPDTQALCTETRCTLLELSEIRLHHDTQQLEKFYKRVEDSLDKIRSRRDGK